VTSGTMAILPQKPKSSYVGKISVVTSGSVEIGEGDGRPAGRRKREMRKFGGMSMAGLDPKPSDDVDDPLVRLPYAVNGAARGGKEDVADKLNRIGRGGRRKRPMDR
jgi:hypothetical protein